MYASQMCFQVDFLPKELVAQRTPELRRHIITAHHVTFQVMFKFERARTIFADELWLYSAFELQMT